MRASTERDTTSASHLVNQRRAASGDYGVSVRVWRVSPGSSGVGSPRTQAA